MRKSFFLLSSINTLDQNLFNECTSLHVVIHWIGIDLTSAQVFLLPYIKTVLISGVRSHNVSFGKSTLLPAHTSR